MPAITPFIEPAAVVKHCLSNPNFLKDWLTAKGKDSVGTCLDRRRCVLANYLTEHLNTEGWEFDYVDVDSYAVYLVMDAEDLRISLPDWSRTYLSRIDAKNRDTYSGNLAKNILRTVQDEIATAHD